MNQSERRPDILAFLVAFSLGFGATVLLKAANAPQLIATFTVASVVIGYGVVAANVPRLRVRLDQAGDNAYYLGLLFTLISMAWALYSVSTGVGAGAGDKEYSAAEKIIGDFGIALGSTVSGILVRIVLHQMRLDPADIEKASRLELSIAAEQLGAKFREISSRMGEFYEQTRQTSEDASKALVEDYRKMAEQICGQLQIVGARFSESFTGLQGSIEDSVGRMTSEVDSAVAGLKNAVERLQQIEPPPTQLNRRLEKIMGSLGTAGELLNDASVHIASTSDRLVASGKAVDSASERIAAHAVQQQGELSGSVERSGKALELLEERLSSLGTLAARHAEIVAGLESRSIASAEAVRQAQDASVLVLNALSGITERVEKSIAKVTPAGA